MVAGGRVGRSSLLIECRFGSHTHGWARPVYYWWTPVKSKTHLGQETSDNVSRVLRVKISGRDFSVFSLRKNGNQCITFPGRRPAPTSYWRFCSLRRSMWDDTLQSGCSAYSEPYWLQMLRGGDVLYKSTSKIKKTNKYKCCWFGVVLV